MPSRTLEDYANGRALEDSLIGAAKKWRDYVILTSPGKDLFEATLVLGAGQQVMMMKKRRRLEVEVRLQGVPQAPRRPVFVVLQAKQRTLQRAFCIVEL